MKSGCLPCGGVTGSYEIQSKVGQAGRRELDVFYGEGMDSSKLKIAAAQAGTARNMNTVAKLVDIALGIAESPD